MRTGLSLAALSAMALVMTTSGAPPEGGRSTSSAAQPGALQGPLLIDNAHLTSVRHRIARGDATLKPAVAALEADAKKALATTPVSVMDKRVTPPSGDKHDYMSQAPYWWPDPTKPDGLPYVHRDGERNPEIGRITDRENLGRLGAAVSTLGLAFHLTSREEYASHAARLVRVWFLEPATRMNPHLQFGQGIPGITDGRGIGIIETRLLVDVIDGVRLLAGSRGWTSTDEIALQDWMRAYLTWLVESSHGQDEAKNGNNHETWYDVQVAALALHTGRRAAARETLLRSRERIARHIEADGRQPREVARTRSWDYSIFNLTAFFHLAILGERVGVDLWHHRTPDGRSLRNALDFLVQYVSGDRRWPHTQITSFRPGEIHWLLRRAAVAWKAPKYQELAVRVGGGAVRLDLLYPSVPLERAEVMGR